MENFMRHKGSKHREEKGEVLHSEKSSDKEEIESIEGNALEEVTISSEEYNRLREYEEKCKEYYEQLLRLKADYENAFKQFEKQREEYIRLANFALLRELIVVFEDIEKMVGELNKYQDDLQDVKIAAEMIYKNFKSILSSQGVSTMEVKNKPFDPFFHEAVSLGCDENIPDGVVLEEVQRGYTIGNKILRTAKVIVNRVSKIEETEDVSSENESNNGELEEKEKKEE